jgi:non-heme chloroperoxidase
MSINDHGIGVGVLLFQAFNIQANGFFTPTKLLSNPHEIYPMSTKYTPTGSITTSDGVVLRYIQAGPSSSPTLILIPGWAQTAAQWHKQISHFSSKYNVIAYDHRGQGESDKPTFGYRVARLAADLSNLVLQLDLKDITLVGHSMGCSVIWAYWTIFAESRKRTSKLVLVDQSSCMTADPSWSEEEATDLAAGFKVGVTQQMASGLRSPGALPLVTGLLRSMFTPAVSEEDIEYTIQQSLKMSYDHAATLLVEHGSNDWRDVLPTINVPTLVVGAEKSLFSREGLMYIAEEIPGARLKIFSEEEKGSHFMFWENPELFNRVVENFLEGGSK